MSLMIGFLNLIFSEANQIVVFTGLVVFAALFYLWAIMKFEKTFFNNLKNKIR